MITWINHCNEDCRATKNLASHFHGKTAMFTCQVPIMLTVIFRYVIPCEFGLGAWIFVAECSPEYLRF